MFTLLRRPSECPVAEAIPKKTSGRFPDKLLKLRAFPLSELVKHVGTEGTTATTDSSCTQGPTGTVSHRARDSES